jgi:hypothetical protein
LAYFLLVFTFSLHTTTAAEKRLCFELIDRTEYFKGFGLVKFKRLDCGHFSSLPEFIRRVKGFTLQKDAIQGRA